MSFEGQGNAANEGLIWDGTKQVWVPVFFPDGSVPMSGGLDMGGNNLGNVKNVNYSGVYAASAAVDWANGQKQSITLTAAPAFTFTGGVAGGNYVLHITQDGTGTWVPTWPANVKSSGGTIRVSVGANSETILAIYFDGSFYHLFASPDEISPVTTDPV